MEGSVEEWAKRFGALPLQEAAKAAGISVASAKRRIAARPSIVAYRRASRAGGRPSPHVLPSDLTSDQRPKTAKASARFAHRCRLAGVEPERTLWRIVQACLPDADKLHDALRLADDDEAGGTHNGRPLFLAWVGGARPLPAGQPRTFSHWLARYIRSHAPGKVPLGNIEKLWRRAMAATESRGRLYRHLILQRTLRGKWRLADAPEYWRDKVPSYAGEDARRFLDRQGGGSTAKGAHLLGEFVLKGGTGSPEVELLSVAQEFMRRAKASPRFPAFSNSSAALGADSYAVEALIAVRRAGLSRAQGMAFLGAYWHRAKHPLPPELSPSAVRLVFGMKTRARTGERPERARRN
jgi:hypothetical protein